MILNRRTTATYADTSLDITWTYDQTMGGNKGVGKLTSLADSSGSTAYTYNSRGLITGVNTTIGADSYPFMFAYNVSGQLTDITYPSGSLVSYNYDNANRISQVTTTRNGVTTMLADNISYQPFGPMKALTYGNGLSLTRSHDLDYRITGIIQSAVMNRSYGFDTSNNIKAITDNLSMLESEAMAYDDLDRLSNATGNYGDYDFTYDATGNRTSLTLNSMQSDVYSYISGTHYLDTITGTNLQTYSYDQVGNIINRNGITQVYNDRNRLSQITDGGNVTNYTYNAIGQRVQKTSAGAVTKYVYAQHQLLLESEGTSNREYAYLNNQPLAAWYTDNGAEAQYYFHNDHLGTPQAMTDSSGTKVWEADYQPFGKASITLSNIENNLRFPGQYYDAETGLHYNYYRYYDPETGRYITSDPIGLGGGVNTYTYVRGNPLNSIDSLGLMMSCVQNRHRNNDTKMYCHDSTDGTNNTYDLKEPANNGNANDPYGPDGKLSPGYYKLYPRQSNGRVLPKGSPLYTTPYYPTGTVRAPNGQNRSLIGPHQGRRSEGCPLFPFTPTGKNQKEDFYKRFKNNIDNGGTEVWIQNKQ